MSNTIEQTISPEWTCSYIPEKKWYVWADDNNVIFKSIASLFELSNLTSSDTEVNNLRVIRVGNVSEELFNVLSRIGTKPYYLGVIDEDQEEIYHFKLKAKILSAVKKDDRYIVNDHEPMKVEFNILDENDSSINNKNDIVSIKCIGGGTVGKQYKIESVDNTLEKVKGSPRLYNMNINDKLLVHNIGLTSNVSIRVTYNYTINDSQYRMFRYLSFNSHD